MNITEAINFVRTLLDEPKYEYHGNSTDLNTVFITALKEAATIVARECWYRGEKEAIRTLWTEVVLALNLSRTAVMPGTFLFIDSVKSNFTDASGTEKEWPHKYVSPAVFSRRNHRSPFETNSGSSFDAATKYYGRAEYTIIGGNIIATSNPALATADHDVKVAYIATPDIQLPLSNKLPLADYMHAAICDRASEILYRKEHPGDDRQNIGGILDVESALYKVMRTPKQ